MSANKKKNQPVPMSKKQQQQIAGSESLPIVPIHNHFVALRDTATLKEVAEANFGTRKASAFDLERIKLGSGGMTQFVITDPVDGEKVVPSFQGVIAFWLGSRVFWQKSFEETGGGAMPDCASFDLKSGFGAIEENGDKIKRPCDACPMNQWGSGKQGIGKACREIVQIFLLRKDANENFFPSLLVAPPGSLKPWNAYMMGLLNKGIPFFAAEHEFTLEREQSKSGVAYAQLRPRFIRKLDDAERAAIASYGAAMKPLFNGVTPTSDFFEAEGSAAQ